MFIAGRPKRCLFSTRRPAFGRSCVPPEATHDYFVWDRTSDSAVIDPIWIYQVPIEMQSHYTVHWPVLKPHRRRPSGPKVTQYSLCSNTRRSIYVVRGPSGYRETQSVQPARPNWIKDLSEAEIAVCAEVYTEGGTIYSPYSLAAFGRDAHGRQTSIYDLSALDCTNG